MDEKKYIIHPQHPSLSRKTDYSNHSDIFSTSILCIDISYKLCFEKIYIKASSNTKTRKHLKKIKPLVTRRVLFISFAESNISLCIYVGYTGGLAIKRYIVYRL